MKALGVSLPIHETFQHTVQGEGFWAGALVDFIRLAGCPVGCPWCDTGYANGGRGLPRISTSIDDLLAELKSTRVVISGGEPFIHQGLPDLVSALLGQGHHVSIETSGAFWQKISPQAWITLSPKQHVNPRYPVQPQFWDKAAEIKLVVDNGTEVNFYQPYLENFLGHVYLQPQWDNKGQAIPFILDTLSQYPHWKMSTQIHKFVGVQ